MSMILCLTFLLLALVSARSGASQLAGRQTSTTAKQTREKKVICGEIWKISASTFLFEEQVGLTGNIKCM